MSLSNDNRSYIASSVMKCCNLVLFVIKCATTSIKLLLYCISRSLFYGVWLYNFLTDDPSLQCRLLLCHTLAQLSDPLQTWGVFPTGHVSARLQIFDRDRLRLHGRRHPEGLRASHQPRLQRISACPRQSSKRTNSSQQSKCVSTIWFKKVFSC